MSETLPSFQFYSVNQVATALNVSTRTIYRWLKSGKLEAQRIGPRQHRISRDALERFLNNPDETWLEFGNQEGSKRDE